MVDDCDGAIYTYSRVQGMWSLLDFSVGYRWSYFGYSLAFSEDSILAVGAPYFSK